MRGYLSIFPSIIAGVKEKIDRLKRPHEFSCRPILIHVNEHPSRGNGLLRQNN